MNTDELLAFDRALGRMLSEQPGENAALNQRIAEILKRAPADSAVQTRMEAEVIRAVEAHVDNISAKLEEY